MGLTLRMIDVTIYYYDRTEQMAPEAAAKTPQATEPSGPSVAN